MSGEVARYKYALPWVPMRNTAGKFISQIPEDTREHLMNYLIYARLKVSDVTKDFSDIIRQSDEKVNVLFVKAFVDLASAYLDALASRADWTQPSEGVSGADLLDEMEERTAFLCSVANDVRRIEVVGMFFIEKGQQTSSVSDATSAIMSKCSEMFNSVISRSVECIANVAFKILAQEELWLQPSAHIQWIPKNAESVEGQLTFLSQVTDFSDLLESRVQYLDPFCSYRLVNICAKRLVGRYLFLLKHTREAGRVFSTSSSEIGSLVESVDAIKSCLTTILNTPETAMYLDAVLSNLRYLDQAVVMMTFGRDSLEFENTMSAMLRAAQGHPEDADVIAKFVECCVGLRSDSPRPSKEVKRRSSVLAIISTATAAVAATTPHTHLDPTDPAFELVAEIRDCYEPSQISVPVESRNPLSLIFDESAVCTIDNFLCRPDKIEFLKGQSQKSIIGSVMSIVSGAPEVRAAEVHAAEEVHHIGGGGSRHIAIEDISASNLPILSGKPKAFLSFSVGRHSKKTSVKYDDTDPRWVDRLEFEVDNWSDAVKLECSLYYKGTFYGDDCIGSVSVPLVSLDVANMEAETFRFEDWKTPKAKAAAEKCHGAPSLSVTVKLVK